MTLRKWFHLFWTTLVLGTVTGLIIGVIMTALYKDFSFLELADPGFNRNSFIFMILGGATISVLSQMGYFSYLIIRYLFMGMLRSKWLWDAIQLLLVIVAVGDTIYLRYSSFHTPGEKWIHFAGLPGIVLAAALAIAWWKVRLTNPAGFVPTLFFMYVVTILEAVQALRLNSPPSNWFMLAPLIVCNAYQILILPRLLRDKKS